MNSRKPEPEGFTSGAGSLLAATRSKLELSLALRISESGSLRKPKNVDERRAGLDEAGCSRPSTMSMKSVEEMSSFRLLRREPRRTARRRAALEVRRARRSGCCSPRARPLRREVRGRPAERAVELPAREAESVQRAGGVEGVPARATPRRRSSSSATLAGSTGERSGGRSRPQRRRRGDGHRRAPGRRPRSLPTTGRPPSSRSRSWPDGDEEILDRTRSRTSGDRVRRGPARRGLDGTGHRPGRLLGRREQGVRGHQLHAPLRHRAGSSSSCWCSSIAARSSGRCRSSRCSSPSGRPRARLPARAGGRRRSTVRSAGSSSCSCSARARTTHCSSPRATARSSACRGQARGDAGRAAPGRPCDRRLRRHRRRSAPLPLVRVGQLDGRARARRARWASRSPRSRCSRSSPRLLLVGGRARVLALRAAARQRGRPPGTVRGGGSGERIDRRHRPVWIVTALGLGALALGTLTLDDDLTTANAFRGGRRVGGGAALLEQSFPAGASAPTVVLVRDPAQAAARSRPPGVARGRRASASRNAEAPGTRFEGHARRRPVRRGGVRRDRAARASCEPRRRSALVGGRPRRRPTCAPPLERDTKLLVPLVLAGRARDPHAAPALARRAAWYSSRTVVLSFAAALGASLLAVRALRRLPGRGSELPALRLHLPRRARGRLQHLPHGARPRGGARAARRARRCSRGSPSPAG